MTKKMRPMSDRKFLSNINREYVVQEIAQTETLCSDKKFASQEVN